MPAQHSGGEAEYEGLAVAWQMFGLTDNARFARLVELALLRQDQPMLRQLAQLEPERFAAARATPEAEAAPPADPPRPKLATKPARKRPPRPPQRKADLPEHQARVDQLIAYQKEHGGNRRAAFRACFPGEPVPSSKQLKRWFDARLAQRRR